MPKGSGLKISKLGGALDSDEAMVRQQREQAAQVDVKPSEPEDAYIQGRFTKSERRYWRIKATQEGITFQDAMREMFTARWGSPNDDK